MASAPFAPLQPSYHHQQEEDVVPQEKLEILMEQGFTRGLATSLQNTKRSFALRIWIVDNSGSMQTADGHKLVTMNQRSLRLVPCTRWEELCDTIEYHAQLADLLQAPTQFRLLNHPGAHVGPQQILVAAEKDPEGMIKIISAWANHSTHASSSDNLSPTPNSDDQHRAA